VQGDIYTTAAGESVNAVSYTAPYSRIVDANADLSGGNLMAKWKKTLNDSDDIQIQAYYDKTNRYEPNFADLRNTFDVDFLQHLRLPDRNELSWGLGARFSLADNQAVVSGLTFEPSQRTDQLFTGFLQDDVSLLENQLVLTFGTKVLHTNFTGAGFEPSVRLAWTPGNNNTFWSSYTHALRTPSDADEDFYLSGYITTLPNGTPYFARFNGNTRFAPEQLNAYEAGYRHLFSANLYLGIATFYNHYHDLVDEEITGSAFLEDNPAPPHYLLPAQFGNGFLGTTKGGEFVPSWRISDFLRLQAAYAFLQMDVRPSPFSRDVQNPSAINGASPRHELSIHSSIDLPKKLSLDLDWRYVSALTGLGVPAYSTADARFGWKFTKNWELSLAGRNLVQPSHAEYAGDPGPLVGIKRSAYAKLTWTR
jgi:iron complex outermembrane receptor protein